MKLKANRQYIEFTYEFANGEEATFKYFEPNTQMIDKAVSMNDADAETKLKLTREMLDKLIVGDSALKKVMFKELETIGNIYEFKAELDNALGKLKKKGKRA